MKKALSLILAYVLCLSLCACGSSNAADYEYNTTENNSNYDRYEDDYLSVAEAEQKALRWLYFELDSCFGDHYDISATRYSVGAITGSSSQGYTVYGKYYLYDNYGNLKKAYNLSVKVNNDGSYSSDLFAD